MSYALPMTTSGTYPKPYDEHILLWSRTLTGIPRDLGGDPLEEALAGLARSGEQLGYDAVIGVRLLTYTDQEGPAIVAYGTAIKLVA